MGVEQDANDRLVEVQEKAFRRMLKAHREDKLLEYADQKRVLKEFGEPIYVKNLINRDDLKVMWMYRRPVNFFDSDRVLLYFNASGKLVSYDYQPYAP